MDSFLSPAVKLQYSISSLVEPTTDPILTDTRLLDWSYFSDIKILNGETINPKYFLKGASRDDVFIDQVTLCTTYIKSCSLFIDTYLRSLTQSEFIAQYAPLEDFLEIFNLNYSGESFLAGLMITSYIDRLLLKIGQSVQKTRVGIKTKHNQIKKVRLSGRMRDLLESEIMESILGPDIIFLLRIFIFHPIGINIKNLLWHGFVSEAENEPSYVAFALVLGLSLNQIYIKSASDDYYRCYIQFPVLDMILDLPTAISIIRSSNFIHPSRLSIVLKSINFYFEHKYWYFIQLIFPEIETGLRCIYAKINNLDSNTTQLEEKMITLVNILAIESNISTILSEPSLHLLFDLLIWKSGPQIRDRISHRLINHISKTESDYTFMLLMMLCGGDNLFVREFGLGYIPTYNPLCISLFHINMIQKLSSRLHKTDLTDTINKFELRIKVNVDISHAIIYQSKEAGQIFSIVDTICLICGIIHNQLSDQFELMSSSPKLTSIQRTSFAILSYNYYLFGDIIYIFKLICEYAMQILFIKPISAKLFIPKLVLCQRVLIGQLQTLTHPKKRMYQMAIATFFCYLGPDLISNPHIQMVSTTIIKQLDSQFERLIEY